MRTIHIMSGLPASGKSTYCNKRGTAEGATVIHRDDVRAILREQLNSTEVFPCPADQEYDFFITYVVEKIAWTKGDVWIDQTTLSTGAALKLLFALDRKIHLEDFAICFEVIHTPVDVCVERDAKRTGYEHVTEEIIRNMSNGFNISLERILDKAPQSAIKNMRMSHHYF